MSTAAANSDAPNGSGEFILHDGGARRPSSIGHGAVIRGNISSDHELYLNGTIDGEVISTVRVVLESSGAVKGRIVAPEIVISGRMIGDLEASTSVHLSADAEVRGDIETAELTVEPGATFVGRCLMPGQI